MHYNQISHFLIRIITLHRKKKKITTNTLLAIKIYILVTAANRSKDRWKFSACVYIQWSAVIECLNTSFPDNLYIGTLQWKEKNNPSCLSYVFNWRKKQFDFRDPGNRSLPLQNAGHRFYLLTPIINRVLLQYPFPGEIRKGSLALLQSATLNT